MSKGRYSIHVREGTASQVPNYLCVQRALRLALYLLRICLKILSNLKKNYKDDSQE